MDKPDTELTVETARLLIMGFAPGRTVYVGKQAKYIDRCIGLPDGLLRTTFGITLWFRSGDVAKAWDGPDLAALVEQVRDWVKADEDGAK